MCLHVGGFLFKSWSQALNLKKIVTNIGPKFTPKDELVKSGFWAHKLRVNWNKPIEMPASATTSAPSASVFSSTNGTLTLNQCIPGLNTSCHHMKLFPCPVHIMYLYNYLLHVLLKLAITYLNWWVFHRHNAGHDIDNPLWIDNHLFSKKFIVKVLYCPKLMKELDGFSHLWT